MNGLRRAAAVILRVAGWIIARLMRLLYVVAITLATLILWLLFTTSGAAWLAERLAEEEPRLALTVEGGSLWNGLEVADVRWRDRGIRAELDAAEVRWNPLCLLGLRVCLGAVWADGVAVEIDTGALGGEGAEADAGDDEPMGRLSLPVAIELADAVVTRATVAVDDHRFEWRHLSLAGELQGDRLRLERLRLVDASAGLAIAEEEASPEVAEDQGSGFLPPDQRAPIVLPDIALPLDVIARDARVRDLRIQRGSLEEHLPRLDLDATLIGRDLRVAALRLEHARGQAELDGRLRLADDWPVDIDLSARLHDAPEVGDVAVEVSAWNSVHELDFRLRADGPGSVSAEGSIAPLEPLVPHDLTLTWRRLAWPLRADAPDISSPAGEITLAGDLEAYAFDLALSLDGAQVPPSDWQATGTGDWSRVRLERLHGALLGGELELSGDAGWWQGVDWDVRLAANALRPVRLWPEAPDAVSGQLTSSGRLEDGALHLDAMLDGVEASLRGYTVVAGGDVSHRPDTGWRVRDLGLVSGDNRVLLNGSATDQALDLTADVALQELSMFLPDVGGAVEGRLSASGPLTEPDVRAGLTAQGLRYGDLVSVDAVDLDAEVASLGLRPSRVELDLRGVETDRAEARVEQLALRLDGRRDDHRLTLDLNGEPATLDLELAGGLDVGRMRWAGAIERLALGHNASDLALALDDTARVDLDIGNRTARVGPHCWRHAEGRLCADEDLELGERGRAGFRLEGYQLAALEPLLPEDARLLGVLNGQVDAQWAPDSLPSANLVLAVSDAGIQIDDPELNETVEFRFETLETDLTLDDDALAVRLALASEGLGEAALDVEMDVVNGALATLDGRARLNDLDLSVAQPFFLELRQLEGVINAEGRLSGTPQQPRFDGQLRLDSGTVETLAVPVTIRDIRMQVDVAGDSATLDGGFRSGGGEAELRGEADWSDADWRATMALTGQRLELAYDTIATVEASPDLRLDLSPRRADLSGEIRVPRGNVRVQSLPEGATRVSGDAVVIENGEEDSDDTERIEADAVPAADGWVVTTDIEIVLGNRVNLDAFGVTGRLEGELGVRQGETGTPQGAGEIRIADGEYRAYGQRLRIREGQLLFSGPLDRPQLYAEAIRTIDRPDSQMVVAGLRLEGQPDAPRVSLFSEPAMEEDMILSYIILGRPLGEEGPGGEQVVARAALALGIAGGGGVAGSIAEDLGIEDFELDTEGDGDDTQFVVRGRLSPNLYVSYGVGVFQAENTLTLRYRLSRRLFVEAVSGLENALDLLYTFEF